MQRLSLFILALIATTAYGVVKVTQSTTITPEGPYYNAGNPYVPTVWNYDYKQIFSDCPVCTVADKCGPQCWGNIVSPGFVCSGASQSPVNIVRAQVDNSLAFPTVNAINGGCSKFYQFADDHSFEAKVKSCSNLQLTYENKVYTFLQIHWHANSEHTVEGKYYDAEGHMVHQAGDGSLLVIAIFMTVSRDVAPAASPIANFWEVARIGSVGQGYNPNAIYSYEYEVEGVTFNPYLLIPDSETYYTYSGSLTTPKCSGPVRFIVMEEPVLISDVDLFNMKLAVAYVNETITLKEFGYGDFRPVQPLNGRVIKKYVDTRPTSKPTSAPSTAPKICQYSGYCKLSSDCNAGNRCFKQNDYYSQCLPDPNTYKTANCVPNWGRSCTANSDCCDPGAYCNSNSYKQCQQPVPNSGLCTNPSNFI